MAVTDVSLHSAGVSGAASPGGKGTVKKVYRSRYRVFVNDVNDAPTQIFEHFQRTKSLPWIGRSFKWGNGTDTNAKCTSLEPEYIEKSEGWWDVRAVFDPDGAGGDSPQDGAGTDANGNATDDPAKLHHDIDVSYTQISIPVEQATLVPGEGLGGPWLRKDKLGPVINSAGVPFDPGIEEEVNITVVRITRPLLNYNSNRFNRLIGTVNNDHVTITKPTYKFYLEFSPQVGKIHNISATLQSPIKGLGFYYLLTTEIHISPIGWRRLIVDRGLMRSAAPGDPDGAGGALYASSGDTYVEGTALHAAIKDLDGYPITEPVLLDGKGQPLGAGKDPVTLTYQISREIPFGGLSYLWE